VEEGDVFRVECIDWTGVQIKNNDNSDNVKNVNLSQVHYLSGPIEVKGAEPGDLLKVECLDLGPLDGDEWGFTRTFAHENVETFWRTIIRVPQRRFGILKVFTAVAVTFPVHLICRVDFHPGLIGTAPSDELLKMWNDREAALVAEEGTGAA
jgi:formamidase